MIDFVTSDDLRELADITADHCVSMLLPTHPVGPEQAQDPIRFRNLLTQATADLVSLGLRSPEAAALLAPATALLDDQEFWAHQARGLALYVGPDSTVAYRLSEPMEELVVIADRFHLKPLIAALATGKTFHVLALSQNRVRLLRGDPLHLSEIGLGDVPHSLADVLRYDDRERQIQSHGADRVGRGRVAATFHGHGGTKDSTKSDLARFFRSVDAGIRHLFDDPATPLVLAGVNSLLAAYRGISTYPRIAGAAIEGNPDKLGADELHRRAWPLVEPLLAEGRSAATETFLANTTPASSSLEEILPAAFSGRVDTLFVPVDAHCWGSHDANRQRVDVHDTRQPGDHDLLDRAAIDTLTHGGVVYVVSRAEVPGGEELAALFRY